MEYPFSNFRNGKSFRGGERLARHRPDADGSNPSASYRDKSGICSFCTSHTLFLSCQDKSIAFLRRRSSVLTGTPPRLPSAEAPSPSLKMHVEKRQETAGRIANIVQHAHLQSVRLLGIVDSADLNAGQVLRNIPSADLNACLSLSRSRGSESDNILYHIIITRTRETGYYV